MTTMPNSYDVLVVGAGPAGAAAALPLAQAGLRVAILEKAVLPRYKTCGGGLLTRTLKLLPFDVSEVVESACFSAELHHHSPRLVYSTRRDDAIVSMVMRDQFDHLLVRAAQRAGADVFTGASVTEVISDSGGFRVRTPDREFAGKFLIGADGVSSRVAKVCGFPELRDVVPALECEIKLDTARQERFHGVARFDFGLTPHGYGWVFPKRDHLSVGVLTTLRGSCNLNEEYPRYLATVGLDNPREEQRHGYMIPLRPRHHLFDRPGVFLVGDAAGLADPVTAEGISAAIWSGQLAAQAIVENQQRGADKANRAYRDALERALLKDLRVARRLARVLYHWPRVRTWAFVRHGQRLSEFVTEIVAGRATYRDAVRNGHNYWKLLSR